MELDVTFSYEVSIERKKGYSLIKILWIRILRKTPERLLSILFSLLIIKPPHNSYCNITIMGRIYCF